MAIRLRAAVCSNKGRVRQNNEDNFCLRGKYMGKRERDAGALYKMGARRPPALFAVLDGMGGEEAGEDASLLGCQICREYMKKGGELGSEERLTAFLRDGCRRVAAQAEKRGNHSGCTIALLAADSKGITAANMGDSRIYSLRSGWLMQISLDHTEMQRLLSLGEITPQEIPRHPKRHMIRQYWGMPLEIAPFEPFISAQIAYKPGDRYLLCSDGLTDMVGNERIEEILAQKQPPQEICRQLVTEAMENGGRDNVTAMVVVVENFRMKILRFAAKAVKAALVALLLLATLALAAYVFWRMGIIPAELIERLPQAQSLPDWLQSALEWLGEMR